MNTPQMQSAKSAKLSFIINGILGVLMLIVSGLLVAFDRADFRESYGLLIGSIACLFAASLGYTKYLSLAK